MGRRRGDRQPRVAPTGSVGSGAGNLFVSRLIVAAAGWIGTIIIARQLSPSGWGGYSFVFGVLGIVGIVVDLQVGRVVLSEVLEAGDDAGRIIGSYVCLRALIGLVALVVAVAVVLLGGYEDRVVWATVVAGLGYLFISPGNGLIVWFQARLWLRPVAVSNVLAALTQLGVVVAVAALARGTLVQFATAFVASQFVILAWRTRVLLRHHIRFPLRVDPARWWSWTKEAVPLTIGLALVTLYYKIDIVLLGQLDTLRAVGQYGIGYKFADLAGSLSLTFLVPLMTVMVAAWPDDVAAVRRYFRQALTVLLLAGTFLAVGFALVAGPLVKLLYGARYAPSVGAARLLVVGAVVQFFSYLCYVSLVSVGRNRPYAIGGIVGVVVNVALNLVLIPRYSFRGSAAATVITEVLVLTVLLVALRRTPGVVSVPWRVVAGLAIAAGGMAGTYLAAERLVPWAAAGALAVGVFVVLLHVLGAEEPGGLRAFARIIRFDARIDSTPTPNVPPVEPST
ncbi:MAG: oligosaccharide flippase family protein [Actinomycetota bacterium]